MDYNIKRLTEYSEENLLNEIKRIAKIIGKDTMTFKEFKATGGRISDRPIRRIFGSWNAALEKAGISKSIITNISDKDLFAEIGKLWDQLGRQPTQREMQRLGRFSQYPYIRRFGSWLKALEEFTKWKNKNGVDSSKDLQKISPDILPDQQKQPRRVKKVEYGEPIDFLGLRHAPLNEQGVVYLFGMLSRQLGFVIEAVRTDFPDCEGKREIRGKKGKWERVAIEFEYKSSNFKEHGHNPDECDVIVCWENDWKECPIEVISLKEIMKEIKE
jgi:hypothetical protein